MHFCTLHNEILFSEILCFCVHLSVYEEHRKEKPMIWYTLFSSMNTLRFSYSNRLFINVFLLLAWWKLGNVVFYCTYMYTQGTYGKYGFVTQALEWLRILKFLLALSTDKRKYHLMVLVVANKIWVVRKRNLRKSNRKWDQGG